MAVIFKFPLISSAAHPPMCNAVQESCQFEKMAELRGSSNRASDFAKDDTPQIGNISQHAAS